MPGIHVAAEHDDFVLEIAAGNFCNRVVSHQIVIVKLHLQIDAHF